MKSYKVGFNVELRPSDPYDLPTGTMCYDGYTTDGVRIHVVDTTMESPMIWNNAIIISKDMIL
jgi:hypothetical protein